MIKKDFPLFIDYLGIFLNSSEHTMLVHKEVLIERIIKNIEITIYSNVTLYEKYKWLANYILSHFNKNSYNSIDTFHMINFKERLKKL